MRTMIAGLTGERQYVKSYRTGREVLFRDGDVYAEPEEFTRGDVMRATMCDEFLEHREFDALLLLDLDMVHKPYLLERLREHDLPMVTAHYWKRKTPMESICGIGDWPYQPLRDWPETGLMEVSTSGFGAVLIKREVIEAVAKTIANGEHPMTIGPVPEMANGEVAMGSDMRFFFLARRLGYKLMLDCSQESLHGVNVWLSRDLYKRWREPVWEAEQDELNKQARKFYANR